MSKIKLEDKLSNLENIVSKLESGETPLDDAIKMYTEAMTIAKECDAELKNIENKITVIVNKDDTVEEFKLNQE